MHITQLPGARRVHSSRGCQSEAGSLTGANRGCATHLNGQVTPETAIAPAGALGAAGAGRAAQQPQQLLPTGVLLCCASSVFGDSKNASLRKPGHLTEAKMALTLCWQGTKRGTKGKEEGKKRREEKKEDKRKRGRWNTMMTGCF